MSTFKRILAIVLLIATLISPISTYTFVAESSDTSTVNSENSDTNLNDNTSVFYVTNGGVLLDDLSQENDVLTGTEFLLPDADHISRPGYIFEGWFDNKNLDGEPYERYTANGSEEIVFYAKWSPRTYFIAIPESVPSGSSSKAEISADCFGFFPEDKINISVQSQTGKTTVSPTKNGKAANNGDIIADFGSTGTKDIYLSNSDKSSQENDILTFNIQFLPSTVNVKLNSDEGEDLGEISVNTGTLIGQLPAAEKDGYIFTNWCYDSECKKVAASSDPINTNSELYALFVKGIEDITENTAVYCHATDVSPDYE